MTLSLPRILSGRQPWWHKRSDGGSVTLGVRLEGAQLGRGDSIQSPGCGLEMGAWHTCETTHCRGGWAIHHAGKAGYALEQKVGDPAVAARMIYRASTGRSPHFYATNERALEDIRRCAEEDAA
jgi:hypothetical protein